jgi:ATP-binding cassette subfamily A (ABC1) protein 3
MANGKLQCCGSPLFLKKKYGAGYHLTIAKKNEATDVSIITNLIQAHIPNAKLETAAGTEVCYSLPNEDSSRFEALFAEIESKQEKLGIDSYGASITTMEEVFLK